MSARRKVVRRWSIDDKRRIVAEASLPWSSVRQVADYYGLDPAQIYDWRKKLPAPADDEDGAAGFVPVDVTSEPVASDTPYVLSITFPEGPEIQATADVDPRLLDMVLTSLAGR